MITAEDLIQATNLMFDDWEVIKKLMVEYAKEAIKADRINLLEHVIIVDVGGIDSNGENYESHQVDKLSIINAPNIELN